MPTFTLIDPATTPAAAPWETELLDLQLRVARRADELARTTRNPAWPGVWAWIRAEREILHAAFAATAAA
jgi:hypothetical protein